MGALSDQGARLRMWVFESGVGFSSDDLRKMVEHVRAQKVPAVRTAIVSAADLGFGIFRLFQAHAGDLDTQFQIFRDEQDAHGWLEDGASQAE